MGLIIQIIFLSCVFAKEPVFKPLSEESLPEVVSGAVSESPQSGPQEVISGVVRVVRGSPSTEVFFMDRKDSVIIPVNGHHNEIFDACLQSSRSRTPVSLIVNPSSRVVLSLAKQSGGLSAKDSTKGTSSSGPESQKESSPGSK